MATTKTFPVTKDARIARRESDNWDAGSGTSDGLPMGLYGGYRYRCLLGFSVNMSGWTSITSAYLHYRTSNQIHIAFGSNPKANWKRITSSWSEGSSSGLSASNAVIYPGPSVTSTNDVVDDLPTGENDWSQVVVTNMMRDVLAAGAFYGIEGRGCDASGAESDSANNVGEIYSREQGSDAYLEITYETNRAPNAPAPSVVGASGGIVNNLTPTFNVPLDDPDGDALSQYVIQVSTDPAWASTLVNQTVVGPFADGSTQSFVCPVTLTRGTQYYVRTHSWDDNGAGGAWSANVAFKVASLPVPVLTEPSGAGRLGLLTFTPGSGWAAPRLNVAWTFSDPDGGTQASYRVEIASDSAGSPGASFYDTGVLASAATSIVVPTTLVEGAYYHVRVTVVCSHGATATVGYYRIRVRWGVVVHRYDMGGPPASIALTNLDVTDSVSGGGAGKVSVEYATTVLSTDTPAWQANISAAGLRRYFWYRAWLLVWGASPAVSPSLNQLRITYDTTVIVPDNWVRQDPTNEVGDTASFVYGTKSLKMAGTGAVHRVTQQVAVVPRTDYILSARIQSVGNSGAYVSFAPDATTSPPLAQSNPITGDKTFDDPTSGVKTAVWNSGDNTSVYVRCVVTGAAGTSAWFDAIKLEASSVVSPWQPGFIAPAVILDSGGVQIDASKSGIFRLKGSTGGARDSVEIGPHGLLYAGDTEISSPSNGVITVNGNPLSTLGPAPIVRQYIAGATWTKPPGLSHIEVEVQAGGGGSGGCNATAAGESAAAGGGAGGGYAKKLFLASALPATCTIVVGAGGAAGAVTPGAGGAGGLSSFAGAGITTVQGNGGGGGAIGTNTGTNATAAGGSGGTATGGDILIPGTAGTRGMVTGGGRSCLGDGGASALAGGNPGGLGNNGAAGLNYGGGAGGGSSAASNAARGGSGGGDGVVYVTEYYSGIPAGSTVPIVSQGTAFPTSPLVDDRFFRQDLHMEFYWDGTRWLSTEVFVAQGAGWASSSTYTVDLAASQNSVQRATMIGDPGSDIWLLDVSAGGLIASGGTALSASHSWVATLQKVDPTNVASAIVTLPINSGASGIWRYVTTPINALLGTIAAFPSLRIDWVKTGTPGNLNGVGAYPMRVRYRVVAV